MKNKEGLEMEVCTDSKNVQNKDNKVVSILPKIKIKKKIKAIALAISTIISSNSSANQSIDCELFKKNKEEMISIIESYPIKYKQMQNDDMNDFNEKELHCSRYEKDQKLLNKSNKWLVVPNFENMIDQLPETLDKISWKK